MSQSAISVATGEKETHLSQTIDNRTGISKKIQARDFYIHQELQKSGSMKNKEKFEAMTKAYNKKQLPMLARFGGLYYDSLMNMEDMVVKVEKHI